MAKKPRIIANSMPNPAAADRKAQRLMEQYADGNLSDGQLHQELETMRRSGPIGPYASFLFAQTYMIYNSYDRWILRYVDDLQKRYPGNPTAYAINLQLETEFGLNALLLDSYAHLEELDADSPAINQYRDATAVAREAIDASNASWEDDHNSLIALDRARWDVLLGRPEDAARAITMVLSERPLWEPALQAKAETSWDSCRLEEAEIAYATLLKAEPTSAAGLLGMARLLLVTGRSSEAGAYMHPLLSGATFDFNPVLTLELLLIARKATVISGSLLEAIKNALNGGQAPAYFLHLAAAMYLFRGDDTIACKLWRLIEKDNAARFLAEANLDDLKKKPDKRYGPFVFRLIDLVPAMCKIASMEHGNPTDLAIENSLDRLCAAIRKGIPQVVRGLVDIVVHSGDDPSVRLLMSRIVIPWFPELDEYYTELCSDERMPEQRRRFLAGYQASPAAGDTVRIERDSMRSRLSDGNRQKNITGRSSARIRTTRRRGTT
jgi:hypothetical protein